MTIPSDKILKLDIEQAEPDLHSWKKKLLDEDLAELIKTIKSLKEAAVATAPGTGKRPKTEARQKSVYMENKSLRIHYDIKRDMVIVLAVTDKDAYHIRDRVARKVRSRRKAAYRRLGL